MIQQVVGTRVGKYFLPAFAGVAFSNNEFRWSPRINRHDGLVRIVPGLGTRAVDRLSDDFPILIAPGQPGLRVNVTVDEVVRYSPQQVDVINLETNNFESREIVPFLREVGFEMTGVKDIISILKDNHIKLPMGLNIDFDNDDLVATFEGLISKTPFVKEMQAILQTLEKTLGYPVDIEFASDGRDFYLLQCRPQSYSVESQPAPIPKDIPSEQIIFSANRYVSNGQVPDITHLVYVDPECYGRISDHESLLNVGRAVGKLNKLLPKRQFILMGPGRWGSRGDIKLGVNVTYSDINNTAALIEIARKKGNYLPDLSFGTHFFQDLVEAEIRYLPLYPDDEGIQFNERFLTGSKNIMADLIPDHAALADTIRLIDVPQNADGRILRLLMNADLDEAVGILTDPGSVAEPSGLISRVSEPARDNFWHWRLQMVEYIASRLDPQRFGVAGFYVFGSTKNATAGPGSDIDVLIHFQGSAAQKAELNLWLEGWSFCLGRMNFLRTGYRSEGLLDVHLITDEDIANKTSWAVKIGAITDAARPLTMRKNGD
ncbi:MAG: pyruvate, phosphate dikinase, partial [FCB group bacterium]|nr:pyruvate, phosphate dikinase [FCB group bacterium]